MNRKKWLNRLRLVWHNLIVPSALALVTAALIIALWVVLEAKP